MSLVGTERTDQLYLLAEQVLGVCESIYAANGLAVPAVTYVYGPSIPVAACDELVVGWTRIGHGVAAGAESPNWPVKGGFVPRVVTLAIWRFICVLDVPSGEDIELLSSLNPARATADARQIMTEAYVLHRGLVAAHAAGQLNSPGETETFGASTVAVTDAVPEPAGGGVAGFRIEVVMELS